MLLQDRNELLEEGYNLSVLKILLCKAFNLGSLKKAFLQ